MAALVLLAPLVVWVVVSAAAESRLRNRPLTDEETRTLLG